jgi:hypothetical protein
VILYPADLYINKLLYGAKVSSVCTRVQGGWYTSFHAH